MNAMSTRPSPLKAPSAPTPQLKIQQVTQKYLKKNQSYMWKRIKHEWIQKVIKYSNQRQISCKEQIEDLIYKWVKQLMEWIENGSQVANGDKNEEIGSLKKQIRNQIKIIKQKEDKIVRRNTKISNMEKMMEDFYAKLCQNQATPTITAKQLQRYRIQISQAITRVLENKYKKQQEHRTAMYTQIIEQLTKQLQVNKNMEMELSNNIKLLSKQNANFRDLSQHLLHTLQQKNAANQQMAKELTAYKSKYKQLYSVCEDVQKSYLRLQAKIRNYQTSNQQMQKLLIQKQKETALDKQKMAQRYRKLEECLQILASQKLEQVRQKQLIIEKQSSLVQNLAEKEHSTKNNTITNISFQIIDPNDLTFIQPTNNQANMHILSEYVDACVGDLYLEESNDFAMQTQHPEGTSEKVLDKCDESQSCSSSESEYIYECDKGTQYCCEIRSTPTQTNCTANYEDKSQQTQQKQNKVYHQLKQQNTNLTSRNKILEGQIANFDVEINISKKTQDILAAQLQELRVKYTGAQVQLGEVKHRLIEYLQRDSFQQQQERISQLDNNINCLLEQNRQLKKYNQELLETIQYANSLFNVTGSQNNNINVEQKYAFRHNSKYEHVRSNYNNFSQSTSSHYRQNSEKSEEEPIISKYNSQNYEERQTETEWDNSSQEQILSRHNFKQANSFGAAVTRLLSQFIKTENKQQTKMNAFVTLVQMLKPNNQVKEQFLKYVKLRRLKIGLKNSDEDQGQKESQTQKNDIKDRLYRFLLGN